jgi:hypothetical protein
MEVRAIEQRLGSEVEQLLHEWQFLLISRLVMFLLCSS